MQKPELVFVKAGLIERGPKYRWCQGYSLNGNSQPWITRREAQQLAKSQGMKAIFKVGK